MIAAPRERVFAALLDPAAIARWRVPADMTCDNEIGWREALERLAGLVERSG